MAAAKVVAVCKPTKSAKSYSRGTSRLTNGKRQPAGVAYGAFLFEEQAVTNSDMKYLRKPAAKYRKPIPRHTAVEDISVVPRI